MALVPLNKVIVDLLPVELIRDDFIIGYKSTSYEDYLTEFVNSSSLFLSLSQNQSYMHTPKKQQSDGQCDCYSSLYELDFKLLGTQSGIYAKRNLSLQKACVAPGVFATLPPLQREGMETALTGNLLRRYSLDDLLKIDTCKVSKFNRDKLCPEADVKSILKVVKCKKNALFYSTDFFYPDDDFPFEDVVETVQSYVNERYTNLFKFRDIFVPDKDTFFAVVIHGNLCIALWKNESIQFKEHIPLSKSSVFVDLYGTLSTGYTAKLVMK